MEQTSIVIAFENLLNRRLNQLGENDEVQRSDLTYYSKDVCDFLSSVNTQQRKSVKEAAEFCITQARIFNSGGYGWAAEPWCEAAEILYRYAGYTPRRSWWEWCCGIGN